MIPVPAEAERNRSTAAANRGSPYLIRPDKHGNKGMFHNPLHRGQAIGIVGRVAPEDFVALHGQQAIRKAGGIPFVDFPAIDGIKAIGIIGGIAPVDFLPADGKPAVGIVGRITPVDLAVLDGVHTIGIIAGIAFVNLVSPDRMKAIGIVGRMAGINPGLCGDIREGCQYNHCDQDMLHSLFPAIFVPGLNCHLRTLLPQLRPGTRRHHPRHETVGHGAPTASDREFIALPERRTPLRKDAISLRPPQVGDD